MERNNQKPDQSNCQGTRDEPNKHEQCQKEGTKKAQSKANIHHGIPGKTETRSNGYQAQEGIRTPRTQKDSSTKQPHLGKSAQPHPRKAEEARRHPQQTRKVRKHAAMDANGTMDHGLKKSARIKSTRTTQDLSPRKHRPTRKAKGEK